MGDLPENNTGLSRDKPSQIQLHRWSFLCLMAWRLEMMHQFLSESSACSRHCRFGPWINHTRQFHETNSIPSPNLHPITLFLSTFSINTYIDILLFLVYVTSFNILLFLIYVSTFNPNKMWYPKQPRRQEIKFNCIWES